MKRSSILVDGAAPGSAVSVSMRYLARPANAVTIGVK